MTDLAVITPTRGRPERFAAMVAAIDRTAVTGVRVLAAVDDDDPADYAAALVGRTWDVTVTRGPRRSLSAWTNFLAWQALDSFAPPRFLASLGDDHLPRTNGWDATLIGAIEDLGGSGIAYGNDLLQGANLPTAWVMSADIVRELGWMMLPTCQHMYVDTAIRDLGRATELLAYRPGVVIEHVHPIAGKAEMDQSYRESNSAERYAADETAYHAWKRDQLEADADRVRKAVAR